MIDRLRLFEILEDYKTDVLNNHADEQGTIHQLMIAFGEDE